MRRMEAIRRCEELTYQVEALKKENAGLRVQVADSRSDANRVADELVAARQETAQLRKELDTLKEELRMKYVKIGNLLKDNGRLLNINAYLADAARHPRAKRRIDDKGEWIGKEAVR